MNEVVENLTMLLWAAYAINSDVAVENHKIFIREEKPIVQEIVSPQKKSVPENYHTTLTKGTGLKKAVSRS